MRADSCRSVSPSATLDGDGDADVVNTIAGTGGIAVLLGLGDGDGGFTALAPIELPDRPTDVVAGDLDGDGRDDLVVNFWFINTLAPFIAQVDGTFAAAPLIELDSRPDALLADVNGDGRDDLITGDSSGLIVLLGGAGGALAQVVEPLAAGSTIGYLATVQDLTGDGLPDAIGSIYSGGTSRIVLAPALGDGRFGPEQTIIDEYEGTTSGLVFADANGDGLLDIQAGYDLVLANASGGFDERRQYWMSSSRYLDLDGDGTLDRLGVSGGSIQVLLHR